MAQVDDRFFDVDRHGSLRVPGLLWLALAFMARHVIVASLVFATAKRSPDVVRLLGEGFAWWLVLPLELPALALLLAGANRAPDTGRVWRWIWRHGAAIITLLAVVHVGWAGWLLAASDVWRTWPELFLASCCLLDVAIAWAVRKDAFFRQLFADFPAPQPAPH